jgi:hypothetical protein
MLKIYDIVKTKTNVKGYWKQGNKLYSDNIKFYYPLNKNDFDLKLDLLFDTEKQEAVFIEHGQQAFCHYKNGETKVYNHKITLYRKSLSFNEIKNLLDENGGLTVSKREDYFKLEYWKD